MNIPKNHHYVPQHFLKSWTTDGKHTNRYKRNPHNNLVDFRRGVGIAKLASRDHLYVVDDGNTRAEFETSIVTTLLDTPGALVVDKVRRSGTCSLSKEELSVFARYVVMLEARNPRTISQMALSHEDMDRIVASQPQSIGTQSTFRAIANKIMSLDTGKLSSGLIMANDMEFALRLAASPKLEVNTEEAELISSSYPVGRIGRYDTKFLVTLAISPRVGLIWCTMPELFQEMSTLTTSQQAAFINFMSLGYADAAYTQAQDTNSVISNHLGWRIGVEPSEVQNKVAAIINMVKSV